MSMIAKSVTFSELVNRYDTFTGPGFRLKVEGEELRDKLEIDLSSIVVELTSEFHASRCAFTVETVYKYAESQFDGEVFRILQLGAKVEVELGYTSTVHCFTGLITEVRYELGEESAPCIHVECADAKVLLMKTQRLEIFSETSVSEAVKGIIQQPPVSQYLDGSEVEDPGLGKEALVSSMESDYDFLVRQAKYTGFEFFIICGKLYFRKKPSSGSSIITLEAGNGILSYQCILSGIPLVEKVIVQAIDAQSNETVSGEAKSSGNFGMGSTPQKMLGGSVRTYFDGRSTTADMAAKRAKILLDEHLGQFMKVEVDCVGIPQILPGCPVEVKGLMQSTPNTVYITNVRHSFTKEGFYTSFEGRADSL